MLGMIDEYTTILAPAREELKVKGSRFIGAAQPAISEEEVEAFLAGERARYHGATHWCFAFRLGARGERARSSDAGEPAGSAGRPILSVIEHSGLTDVAVVVTRFFGGIKLGVPGLSRAYREAAERAVRAAGSSTRYVTDVLHVSFPHGMVSAVMHVVSHAGARIVDTSYDEEVHLTLEVRMSKREELKSRLLAQTRGNIRMK